MTISVTTSQSAQTSHQVLRNFAVLGLSLTLTVAAMVGLAAVVGSWA
jgi:hypothetical protein